jgi:hypothetical protein
MRKLLTFKGGRTMLKVPLADYELAHIIAEEIRTLNGHIKQAKEKGLRVDITTNSSALSTDTPELSVEIYQRMDI